MSFASVFKEKVMYFPPYVQEIIEKLIGLGPVSYTHLDVYKRQNAYCSKLILSL